MSANTFTELCAEIERLMDKHSPSLVVTAVGATAIDDSALRALVRAMISSEAVSPTDARWVRGGGL